MKTHNHIGEAPKLGWSSATMEELSPHGWSDATLDLMAKELKDCQTALVNAPPPELPAFNVVGWAIEALLYEEQLTGEPPVTWRLFRMLAEMQRVLEQEILYRRLGEPSEPISIRELVMRARS